jgi:hypothetical protein
MERVLDDLSEMARMRWINLARQQLQSSRQDYIQGIQPVQASPGVRTIVLVGWLPNAIEKGLDGFDLRSTILENPNSRIRKPIMEKQQGWRSGAAMQTGWYANVPFRHKTPAATAMGGQPMGSQFGPRGEKYAGDLQGGLTKAESVVLGKNIHARAKQLAATRTVTHKVGKSTTMWGERLPEGLAPKLHERHATDIFAGMVRIRHTYERATQTQYMTWRTISTRNPRGWMHPGIIARGLADQVTEWVEKQAAVLIGRMLQAMERGG